MPEIIKTQNIGMGGWFGKAVTTFWNRTGSTITRGLVAMCDITATQGETTTFKVDGVETDVLANLTGVTQAGCDAGQPIVVCIDDSVADNTLGRFLIFGRIEVSNLADGSSTTDTTKGGRVSILVSESATSVQGWATSATGGRTLGLALEASGASTALKWVLWMGGIPAFGASDT